MQQLAVVRLNVYPTHNQRESTVAVPYPSEVGPCIERLQQEIAHLLIRNQTIRFELLAAHQKIAGIGRALFGAGRGSSIHCSLRIGSGCYAICARQQTVTKIVAVSR
jgi:hypothetical protein